ncbi:MAG: hypothetical protein H7239_07040 [Flavobacterium sp.]|nr:hypothetical protein [Flavobacterium sp.]
MKKILSFLILLTLIYSCHKDKYSNENPYLPNYAFSIDINTSLPTYNNVTFASNAIKAYPGNGPSNGIIVFNTGSGYNAFDGGCPNQNLTSCSALSISGINAKCSCDNALYNMFTGQAPGKQYPLKPYRVEVNGNIIRVSN